MSSTIKPGGRRVLVLLTDAFGGHGGIALYNRDVLTALCEDPAIAEVVAIPRVAKQPIGALPAKLRFELSATGGVGRFIATALRHAIFGGGFDIIYCAHLNLVPIARLIAKLTNTPMVLAIYGIEAWECERSLARRYAGSPDHVLSISKVTLDRFRQWQPYPEDRCTITPNAIHLEQFGVGPKRPDLIERFGLQDRKIVMTFGRLAGRERYKGFDNVLDAMPALLKACPQICYLICGDGDDRGRLAEVAVRLGVKDHVVFTGAVDEAEKADIFRLADVYAMPSSGEGFGFVLLEAMACGIPTIGSTTDGGREALRDGLLGALVDPANRQGIVDAVLAGLARQREVPAGLDYFSFPAFSVRLSAALRSVVDRHVKPMRR